MVIGATKAGNTTVGLTEIQYHSSPYITKEKAHYSYRGLDS